MYDGDRWIHTDARQGDYPWLPLEFDGDMPIMNYYQDWDINLTTGTWRKFDPARNLALNKTATASSANGHECRHECHRCHDLAELPQFPLGKRGQRPAVDHGGPGRADGNQPRHPQVAHRFRQGLQDPGLHRRHRLDGCLQHHPSASAYSVTDETFKTTTARYVRMYGTQRGTQNGYSLFAFMVLKD